ncbi:expressed unknown protein [Ectocarpus siliculosus]|uniref:Uncharacterized protein n=1 Tax=Ectocarpus siliculosus TaxID=2880 RepID=D7FY82_ECTSI|nr:expressed unknown protein [Ectocarpus siliculosus]|eukprot:CBJ26521.1 expressed unknown protein [Ectocarpus siliculosus]
MTTWARMVMKGSKGARREARLENTKEQREKRRSAEEKRAARAAALRERKKIYTEARAALLQPVHQLKLDTIVEHPEEALSTDSKKGQAYRQAYAILFFVSLEYFLLRIFEVIETRLLTSCRISFQNKGGICFFVSVEFWGRNATK